MHHDAPIVLRMKKTRRTKRRQKMRRQRTKKAAEWSQFTGFGFPIGGGSCTICRYLEIDDVLYIYTYTVYIYICIK